MILTKRSKYEKVYKPAERFIIVNDSDRDLEPIKVPIPSECPDIRTINGYGLPPEEQKFKRTKVPKRLRILEEEIEDIEEIEKFLEKNQIEYRDEIDYIEREWQRRDNGYWFFNNGIPTYITGTNYLYIAHWEIDIGLPNYRSRDRKVFLFLNFCDKDELCLGTVYPKHRREGATHKAQVWMYDYISTHTRSYGGIQSATEGHAKDVFRIHLVYGWKSLPFFFKPKFEGTTNPKTELSFNEPSVRVSKGKMSSRKKDYLGSMINFKSSDTKAYDSRKLHRFHNDESGKTTEIDVSERHDVVRECHMDGTKIIGKSFHTSTVEEMEKGGGVNFKKICDGSHYSHSDKRYKRDKNGMTVSGMYLLFIPAQDGLVVDEYGNSDTKAGLEIIENRRQALIDSGSYEKLSSYIRKYPTSYKECWRGDATKCKFNIRILEERLDEFKFGNKYVTRGNFIWKDGIIGGITDRINKVFRQGRVIFQPHAEGRFEVSYLFPNPAESNAYFMRDNIMYPLNDIKFSGGSDPFKFKTTKSSNRSDGAGAVFRKRDLSVDTPDRDINEWTTNRFICTYQHRSREKYEYCEDMLLMSLYYGFQMVTEVNVPAVWEHFDDRGYPGYLFYTTDPATGKMNIRPGIYTTGPVKEDIFTEYHSHIENHGHREVHDKLLEQCYEIEDDMGPYDMFTAGGMALIGAKSKFFIKEIDESTDAGEYFPEFRYK